MSSSVQVGGLGPELPGMRCVELIGSGGFADVYLYERDQPRIKVAVKLIKGAVLDDAKRRQFAAEADVMAELTEHPYIVPVLGAGTAPDGRPYLVMRYYPSSDLAAKVARQPMSVADSLRYGVQLSSAVETAHRAGIIHRDIKPSNILLSSYGQPGLSDFGIAGRPSDVDEDEVGVSIPWSPPEVLTGISNGSVASDVYSLAATVWTLLVGRAPFTIPGGDNSERAMFTRIVHSKPPSTARDDVPASLDRLLQQALSKEPTHRPQSAMELARHFQRVEQELRLARTDIVVLDHAVDTPMTAAHDERRPGTDRTITSRSRGGTDDDRTIRKPPTAVGSVQAAGSTATAPLPVPHADPQPDPAVAQPTERRPQRTNPVQALAPQPREQRQRRPLLVIGGAVAAVVVLLGVFLTVHPGGSSPPTSHDTGVVDKAPADNGLPTLGSGPAAPARVVGRLRGANVRFTWPTVSGATYIYLVDGTTQKKFSVQPYATVPRAASGRTCITVQSSAPGLALSPGTRGCA